MKTKTILAGLLLVLTMTAGTAFAQSDFQRLQPKSTTMAWILGLDPLPGDALFYAGKRGQGAINTILGGVSAAAFYGGLYYAIAGRGEMKAYGGMFMIYSGIPYLGCLLWDAIGGIGGVYKHNDKVLKRRHSVWQNIKPTVVVSNDGFLAGAQISF